MFNFQTSTHQLAAVYDYTSTTLPRDLAPLLTFTGSYLYAVHTHTLTLKNIFKSQRKQINVSGVFDVLLWMTFLRYSYHPNAMLSLHIWSVLLGVFQHLSYSHSRVWSIFLTPNSPLPQCHQSFHSSRSGLNIFVLEGLLNVEFSWLESYEVWSLPNAFYSSYNFKIQPCYSVYQFFFFFLPFFFFLNFIIMCSVSANVCAHTCAGIYRGQPEARDRSPWRHLVLILGE